MRRDDKPADVARRTMLARLGLVAGIAYATPLLLPLSGARASEASGASGASGASYSSSGPSWSAPSRPTPRRQQQAQPRVVAPPPELAVAVPARADFAILENAGYRLLASERIGLIGLWVGRFGLPQGTSLEEARAEAAALLPRARVESNDLYRTSEMLCRGETCDAFDLVGWPQPEPCQAAPVIGMIDAGINPEHDAFVGQKLEVVGYDLPERDPAGRTHGTAVAALLIGRSQSRTPGLLPNASLIAVEAFHTDSLGEAADVYALLRGLDMLVSRGVTVINMSFTGPDNPLLADAIRASRDRDIALVAAAGNAGPRAEPLFPAAYNGVIAVTAIDRRDTVYRQANAGEHIAFAAPGVRMWTAASVSGGRLRSGTSYAAPFVTAALALARDSNPEMGLEGQVAMLARRARDIGEEGFDPASGWGVVQAEGLCLVPVG